MSTDRTGELPPSRTPPERHTSKSGDLTRSEDTTNSEESDRYDDVNFHPYQYIDKRALEEDLTSNEIMLQKSLSKFGSKIVLKDGPFMYASVATGKDGLAETLLVAVQDHLLTFRISRSKEGDWLCRPVTKNRLDEIEYADVIWNDLSVKLFFREKNFKAKRKGETVRRGSVGKQLPLKFQFFSLGERDTFVTSLEAAQGLRIVGYYREELEQLAIPEKGQLDPRTIRGLDQALSLGRQLTNEYKSTSPNATATKKQLHVQIVNSMNYLNEDKQQFDEGTRSQISRSQTALDFLQNKLDESGAGEEAATVLQSAMAMMKKIRGTLIDGRFYDLASGSGSAVDSNDNEEDSSMMSGPRTEEPIDVESRRKGTLQELVLSERDYVDDLQLVVNQFLTPVREKKILTADSIAKIFCNIEILLHVNSDLCNKLEHRAAHEESDVGDLFSQDSFFLSAYSSYCDGQAASTQELQKQVKKNKALADFLGDARRRPSTRGLGLQDFLAKPFQRICKYPLLFRELLACTPEEDSDRANLMEAERNMTELLQNINATSRQSDSVRALIEVEHRLEDAEHFNLLRVGRTFVHQGKVKVSKQPCHLILLSDCLIFCTPKHKKLGYKKVYAISEISHYNIASEVCDFMLVHDPTMDEFPVSCSSKEDKDGWLKALRAPVDVDAGTALAFGLNEKEEGSLADQIKTVQLLDTFSNRHKLPVNPARRLLRQSELRIFRKSAWTPITAFIFTDILALGRPKGEGHHLESISKMESLLVLVMDETTMPACEVIRLDRKTKLLLAAQSRDELLEWTTALQEAIDGHTQKRKELYRSDPRFKALQKQARKSISPGAGADFALLRELTAGFNPEVMAEEATPPTPRRGSNARDDDAKLVRKGSRFFGSRKEEAEEVAEPDDSGRSPRGLRGTLTRRKKTISALPIPGPRPLTADFADPKPKPAEVDLAALRAELLAALAKAAADLGSVDLEQLRMPAADISNIWKFAIASVNNLATTTVKK